MLRRRVAVTTLVSTTALLVVFGTTRVLTWLGAHAAWTFAPTAVGVPYGLPRLRVTPFGGQSWGFFVVELLASVAMVVVATWWADAAARHGRRRAGRGRRGSGRGRLGWLVRGWTGFWLGLLVANVLRSQWVAWAAVDVGWLGYVLHLLAGALVATVWAVVLGWVVGLALALVTVRPGRRRASAGPEASTPVAEPPYR